MVYIFFMVMTGGDVCLLPNDAVEITIWRQPDLSGRYYVDADTNINIPLVGTMPVKHVPYDSLRTMLLDKFDNYYTDVHVDITFYYRINIFGEVKAPGYYYVQSEDNLANLLAQAGGPTDRGSLSGIRILNFGEERRVDFDAILKSGENIDELYMRPGDVVIVPRRFMAAFQEWSVLFTLVTLALQIYTVVR
jgi:protein involved in polysaccharide export with SLBB domain